MARIAFQTSDFGLEPEERKRAWWRSINPELCRITEDLVLTEPYGSTSTTGTTRRSTGWSRSCARTRRCGGRSALLKHGS